MTTELNECPFCDGRNVYVEVGRSFAVVCKSCGAEGPWDLGRSGAITAWNQRAWSAPQEVMRLRRELRAAREAGGAIEIQRDYLRKTLSRERTISGKTIEQLRAEHEHLRDMVINAEKDCNEAQHFAHEYLQVCDVLRVMLTNVQSATGEKTK